MSVANLRLEIYVGSDPIEGLVAAEGRDPQRFCGWVELAAAIELAHVTRMPRLDSGVSRGKD